MPVLARLLADLLNKDFKNEGDKGTPWHRAALVLLITARAGGNLTESSSKWVLPHTAGRDCPAGDE
jgi:hypothetical protein